MTREGLVYELIDNQRYEGPMITANSLTKKDIERLGQIELELEKEYWKRREQFTNNFNKIYENNKTR